MRILRASFIFVLIYVVGFSFVGISMAVLAVPLEDDQSNEFQRAEYSYSIIDRDNSTVSRSIADALVEGGNEIKVTDDRIAIQDAIAKGHVDYLLIIPQGYEQQFLDAKNPNDVPEMEAIYSFSSLGGAYVDEVVNKYVSLLHTLVVTEGTDNISTRVQDALEFSAKQAQGTILEGESSSSALDQLIFYLTWGMYPLFTGITVCIGVLLYQIGRADVRRRNLSSPLSLRSLNTQLFMSCLVIAFGSAAWVLALGAIAFPEGVAQLGVSGMTACVGTVLVFALIPTSIGFMLGMFGASTAVSNSIGNITGLVISFFGGAWFSLNLMAPVVKDIAHWLPGYWYTSACNTIAELSTGATGADISTVLTSLGVMLLFALAFFCIGLAASKKRAQTAEAGGNRAAEVSLA